MPSLEQARYAGMRWNAPLSPTHAAMLLDRLAPGGADILDLGCGWGELLLRAVEAGGPRATGTGVDTDASLLDRGRALATDRGLADRVSFVEADSAQWEQLADRVLCVGASHAWAGGPAAALSALARVTRPGGRVLFGEGCWERTPTPAAASAFGPDVLGLDVLVRAARAAGWRVLHLGTADQREWDDFEAGWRRGRTEWLLAHPDDDRAAEVGATLDAQLTEYVEVYRAVLGFCYLVLAR